MGIAIACIGGAVVTTAAAIQSTSSLSKLPTQSPIAPQVIPPTAQDFPNSTANFTDTPQLLEKLALDNPGASSNSALIKIASNYPQKPLHTRKRDRLPPPLPSRKAGSVNPRITAEAANPTPTNHQPHRSLLNLVQRAIAPQVIAQNPTLDLTAPLNITLTDAIALTLTNNRNIKNAYLERIAQRADLAVAENVFTPRLTPRVESEIVGFGNDGIEQTTELLRLGANVAIRIPTGAEFSAQWQTNAQNRGGSGQGINLSFKQPLLRNAGGVIERADIDIARLQEQVNIWDLQNTLSQIITETILAYRNLIQAQEQVKIQETALENAQQLLERDRALVAAGRIARVDLVRTESRIANVEVQLVEARNNLKQARLDLIDLLDIAPETNLIAIEQLTTEPFALNAAEMQALMQANQPQLQIVQLSQQQAELALRKAENNRRWNLDLAAEYRETPEQSTDVRAGLIVSQELGDRSRERDFQRSQVNLQQAQNNTIATQERFQIELQNRLQTLQLSYEQVQRAIQARQLAEQTLNNAQTLRELGRGDIAAVIDAQEDVVNARNDVLNAQINYLNARSRLDFTIGNTLNTWGVVISGDRSP